MAVLITGLGYIGSRLAEDLLARGESVVAVESFFCTPRGAVAALVRRRGLTLVEGSINEPRTIRRALGVTPVRALVHLAAQPSAHPDAATSRYTELTNLTGARLVLESALDAGIEVVVLGGSFKVYGDDLPAIVTERQPFGPVGDLAHLSKIYVDKLAEMLAATRGLQSVSVRLGITYGLGTVMKDDPRFMTVPNRFAQLAAQGRALSIHASARRPAAFIHLEDASAALLEAISTPPVDGFRAVNAVTECMSVAQVASAVSEAAGSRGLRVQIDGPRDGSGPTPRVESSLHCLASPRRRIAESVGEVLDHFLQARRG